MCYTSHEAVGLPITEFGYMYHDQFEGVIVQATGAFLVPVISCAEWFTGNGLGVSMGAQLSKAGGGFSGSLVVTQDTVAPYNCLPGTGTTSTTGPVTFTPLASSHNEDSAESLSVIGHPDPCSDYEELGTAANLGGLRDPFNPYDFFDPNGDGYISQPEILQVAAAFGPTSDPKVDRGALLGPNNWNRAGPDGTVSMIGDILVIASQVRARLPGRAVRQAPGRNRPAGLSF
jgi:hypothetical protein